MAWRSRLLRLQSGGGSPSAGDDVPECDAGAGNGHGDQTGGGAQGVEQGPLPYAVVSAPGRLPMVLWSRWP